jgi:hypothetical protein
MSLWYAVTHGACLAFNSSIMNPTTWTQAGDRLEPALLDRIRGEFREMPDLQLTLSQAQRLLGLAPEACQRAIDTLVESSFLRWTDSGAVVRAE